MWNLYLDESGDLGFDFEHKKPSRYFIVTILSIEGLNQNRLLLNSVKKTIKRKLNPKKKRKRIASELKGSQTTLEIRKYFFEQSKQIEFSLYAVILDKKIIHDAIFKYGIRIPHFIRRIYNHIAFMVISRFPFDCAKTCVNLIVDKSKARPEIREFNNIVKKYLEGKIDPRVKLHINHLCSQDNYGLQAVDMFCYGIFLKFERDKDEWFEVFKDKITEIKEYK
jgi:hypothetical protein